MIFIKSGQDKNIPIQLLVNNYPIDLTSASISAVITGNNAEITKTNDSSDEIEVTNASNGLLFVKLNESDTLGMAQDKFYSLKVTASVGSVNYTKTEILKLEKTGNHLGVLDMIEKYSKYLRIEAVSPNTFTIEKSFGWTTTPTVALDSGNIVITSADSEFSNDSLVAVSQLDTSFSQTTSTITLTPASASWGTMTIVIKIY